MSLHPHQLHRHLRLFDAMTIVVGSMIGSGIFIGLSIMAQWVQTPGLLIGLWVFGGLFTMLGVVCLRGAGRHVSARWGPVRVPPRSLWRLLGVPLRLDAVSRHSERLQCRRGDCLCQVPRRALPSLGEANVLAEIPLGELLPLGAQAHIPHCLLHIVRNSAQLGGRGVIALLTGA